MLEHERAREHAKAAHEVAGTHGFAVPEPIAGVIFDIHSTLVDQGAAADWLDAALVRSPHDLAPHARAALENFLDRIWEGARVADPLSTRDLSCADHRRVYHELLDAGPGIDRTLADALYEVMLDVWSAYDDTVPMLRTLRAAGLRIALISNAGVPIRTVLDRDGITEHVDAVVLSYEVGCVKPDLRIFRAAVDALGLRPTQVLMVGDSGTDDVGGTPLGIRTLILPRTVGRVHGLDAVVRLCGA
ncbi:MAG: HAD family hydrolase [Actinomycetales bacterium]